MNLRDMQYLVAVADTLSFRKAAEQCYVSQPTLSAQIKKFEAELDVILFERNNKKVMVTETGKAVVSSARRILQERENIRSIARLASDPLSGPFHLGAFPTLAPYLFSRIVPSVMESMPDLRLVLVEEKTDRLIDQLENGIIDAALLAMPLENHHFAMETLFTDKFYLAVPKSHPLGSLEKIGPDAIHDYNLLLLEDGHCLRDQALEVCHMSGIREEHDFRATSLETLRQMIKAGTGISFFPEIAMQNDDPGIRYIPLESPAPLRTIGLAYRKTTCRKAVINCICELIRKCIGSGRKP